MLHDLLKISEMISRPFSFSFPGSTVLPFSFGHQKSWRRISRKGYATPGVLEICSTRDVVAAQETKKKTAGILLEEAAAAAHGWKPSYITKSELKVSRPETHPRGMTVNSHPQAFSPKV